jgi:hypothetical protein
MRIQEVDGQHARAADAVRTEKSRVQKDPAYVRASVALVRLKPDTTSPPPQAPQAPQALQALQAP